MNRIYSLLTVMVLALTLPGARAEVVTNYSFDFSGLSTTAHDFAPSGWGHIVGSYFSYDDWETYYVSYTQKTSGGVDDSPCLYVGSRYARHTASERHGNPCREKTSDHR